MKNSLIFRGLRVSLIKQSVLPAILCALSLWILSFLPFQSFLHPAAPGPLYDTGADYAQGGRTAGHYYYSIQDGVCQLYLLKPQPAAQNTPIPLIRVPAEDAYDPLFSLIASETGWSTERIKNSASPYVEREASLMDPRQIFSSAAAAVCAVFSILNLLLSAAGLLFPRLTPAFGHLRRYGNPEALFAQAEMELKHADAAQAAGIFVTPGFLISLAPYENAILPMKAVNSIRVKNPVIGRLLPGAGAACILRVKTAGRFSHSFSIRRRKDSEKIISAVKRLNPELLTGHSGHTKTDRKSRPYRL